MQATKANQFMTEPSPRAEPSSLPAATPVTQHPDPEAWNRWQQVIDYKLIEWGCKPHELEDEAFTPPLPEIINRAFLFVQEAQQRGLPPPTDVYPDPNGGIVFERRKENISEQYHFWDDGTVDYCRFNGTKLIARWQL